MKLKNIFAILGLTAALFVKTERISWFSVRAYRGDRITVNLHLTIDGEKPDVEISEDSGFRLYNDEKETVLKALADSYDTYECSLFLKGKGKSIPLKLIVRHWNWWEIIESDLYIDIDTKTNSYTTYEIYRYTAETDDFGNINYHYKTEKKPKETIEGIENIEISAGYKG